MKAIEYNQYGGPEVLRLTEIPQPQPKPDQVLVRVHATTVTAADSMMREGKPKVGRLYLGLKAPKRKVLGFEFAGEVVGTGAEVTQFKVGDQVFGGTTTLGCYAEYVCVSEKDVITTLPEHISHAEAAPVTGSAITVWNFLVGKAHLQRGQKVLINGASGALGTYAVQLARHLGAEVTAVCSTANLAMVKALGADHVIDYTRSDFTQGKTQYDVIFDTVSKSSFQACKPILTPKGIYLPTVMSGRTFRQMIWTGIIGGKQVKSSSTGLLPVKTRRQYLQEIKGLMAAGHIKTVIDQTFPLQEIAAAHTYVDQGHKKGNVIVLIEN